MRFYVSSVTKEIKNTFAAVCSALCSVPVLSIVHVCVCVCVWCCNGLHN